jgi:hypothetical protein
MSRGGAPPVCLRCDRLGSHAERVCPRCGVPLYRLPPDGVSPPQRSAPSNRRRHASPARPTTPVPPPRSDDAAEVSEPRRRRLRGAAATLAALALAAGVFWVVRDRTVETPAATSGLSGTLVYAVRDGVWARLWRWDLATGVVREGPRVRDPLALVNANAARPGWVGVTSQLPGGRQEGSVLRTLGPRDAATPLRSGTMITWGAGGGSVVAATRTRLRGCRRHVTVSIEKLVPPMAERQVDRKLCGDILSIGRDGVFTYFTLRTHDHVSIRFAGYGRSHPVLGGYALAGVSADSDLLVVPGSQARSSPRGTSLSGTASFFQGLGSRPVAFGTPRLPFQLDQILGWPPDARFALVAGAMGARSGLFELEVGPNGEHGSPRYIEPIRGPTWATYTGGGVGVVEMDGAFYVLRRGRLTRLALPADAPAPSGPLVWIPRVPPY